MSEKIVGIIGGMGPEATLDLMARIIRATPALDDCDHIRMIVDNNPKVPSRIKALIEGTGESPGPCLAEMGQKLEAWGADFLAMPCNTAHYYHGEIQAAVRIPVLNMIDLTVKQVVRDRPGIKNAGLLASPAVKRTGLFSKSFRKFGVALLYPQSELQESLLNCIKKVKTGLHGAEEKQLVARAAQNLSEQGAEVLVIACTELSLIVEELSTADGWYDSSQILAEEIVKAATSEKTLATADSPLSNQDRRTK